MSSKRGLSPTPDDAASALSSDWDPFPFLTFRQDVLDNISLGSDRPSTISLPFSDSILEGTRLVIQKGPPGNISGKFSAEHQEAMKQAREEMGLKSGVESLLSESLDFSSLGTDSRAKSSDASAPSDILDRYNTRFGAIETEIKEISHRRCVSSGSSDSEDDLFSVFWPPADAEEEDAFQPSSLGPVLILESDQPQPEPFSWWVRERARRKVLDWFEKYYEPKI